MSHFSSQHDINAHLDALGLFHMQLGLERMEAFARRVRPRLGQVVHVVGTNGKGSTSAFLESIARAHGLRTGLHTSPHFLSVRERILCNGQMLPEAKWVQLGNRLMETCADLGLTYFEWLTCLSALAFEDGNTDVAVMEAGLGGRYDATRVFAPSLALLTPVGLDHEKILGHSLAEIADDKSRAIRHGGVAFSAPQHPAVMRVYERRAREVGAEFVVVEPLGEDADLGLCGAHQRENAALALAGWERLAQMLGVESRPDAARSGLAGAWLPGRFQVIEPEGVLPLLVLDGAHNEHGLLGFGRALSQAGIRPDVAIFACMADKNVAAMTKVLGDICAGPVLLPRFDTGGRGMAPERLAEVVGARAQVCDGVSEALGSLAGARAAIVCGSLYLLAEFYKIHPRFLKP